jgi:hypothetical protein
VPSTIEIQVQIEGRGLDVVMTQVIFDMGDGVSPIEHIHSPGMTKAVDGVNRLETFRRKGHGEINMLERGYNIMY